MGVLYIQMSNDQYGKTSYGAYNEQDKIQKELKPLRDEIDKILQPFKNTIDYYENQLQQNPLPNIKPEIERNLASSKTRYDSKNKELNELYGTVSTLNSEGERKIKLTEAMQKLQDEHSSSSTPVGGKRTKKQQKKQTKKQRKGGKKSRKQRRKH
jgi:hypothetical protein